MTDGSIRKVVVFGHSGFIGQPLSQRFLSRQVQGAVPDVVLPAVDLTDASQVEAFARTFDAETGVVFCAGIKKQWGDTIEAFERNMQMALNLCKAIERHPVRRVVFFSSASVYGESVANLHITETTAIRTTSLYGAAKYASEALFERAVLNSGGSLLVLRPPLVYGPGDTSSGYGPSGFVRAAIRQEEIVLWGDGSERREFVYVGDVADVTCRLMFSDASGVLNLVTGLPHTFRQVLDVIAHRYGGTVSVTSRPRSKPKADHAYDNTLLRRLLPDVAFTSLEEGIRRTLQASAAVVQ